MGVKDATTDDFNSHAHVERDDGIQARYDEVYHFNSHAHVERDLYADKLSSYWQISTHTLTWSVTSHYQRNSFHMGHFNSHAHVERDEQHNECQCCRNNFNSHAHVERDFQPLPSLHRLSISTHTLTWSVTALSIDSLTAINISTHTLTWSVTGSSILLNHNTLFQLTRSRGA